MAKLADYLGSLQELAPKFSLGLWLFGISILFLPSDVASDLRIEGFRDQYFGLIALATAGAAFLWVFHHLYDGVAAVIRRLFSRVSARLTVNRRIAKQPTERQIELMLLETQARYWSDIELAILEFLTSRHRDVLYLDWKHAGARSLVERGVLSQPELPSVGSHGDLIVPFRLKWTLSRALQQEESSKELLEAVKRSRPHLTDLNPLFSTWEELEHAFVKNAPNQAPAPDDSAAGEGQ